MRIPIPPIQESVDDLKARLKHEPSRPKQQRLHALYLVVSGQAAHRHEVADLLGVSRNTIGRWFATYAAGGLDALLQIYRPTGKQPALSPDQQAQLLQALRDPSGFRSHHAIQQWIQQTFGVAMSYNAVQLLVRRKLGAKPKVPRPSHQKKRRDRGAL